MSIDEWRHAPTRMKGAAKLRTYRNTVVYAGHGGSMCNVLKATMMLARGKGRFQQIEIQKYLIHLMIICQKASNFDPTFLSQNNWRYLTLIPSLLVRFDTYVHIIVIKNPQFHYATTPAGAHVTSPFPPASSQHIVCMYTCIMAACFRI